MPRNGLKRVSKHHVSMLDIRELEWKHIIVCLSRLNHQHTKTSFNYKINIASKNYVISSLEQVSDTQEIMSESRYILDVVQ